MKVYEIIATEGTLASLWKGAKGLYKGTSNAGKSVASATLPAAAGAATTATETLTKLLTALTALGLGASIWRYRSHMSTNKELLDAGEISKEEFDSRRQAEVAVLTESIAATLAGKFVSYVALGPLRLALNLIPGTKKIVDLLHLTDAAAGAAVIGFLNTQTGREMLAKTLTLPIIGEAVETVFGAGPEYIISSFEGMIRKAIGAEPDKYAPGNYDKFKKPSSGIDSTSGDSTLTLPSDDASIRAGWQPGTGFAKTTN
jgi:hypothetical protein